MKKMLVMFAAVAMAACAQAGALLWKVTSIPALQSESIVPNVTTYSAYLFVESPLASTVADALVTGDTSLLAKAAASCTQTADASGVIAFDSSYGNYMYDTITVSVIVFDAATVTDAHNFLLARTGSGADFMNVWVPGIGAGSARFTNIDAAWQSIGGEAIPEPTSGLMLLLGMAGLALKRSRLR